MGLGQKASNTVGSLQQTTQQSGGCGCFAMGCGITVALLFVMCVSSYFVAMHSSLPLSLLESALEAEGDVEVEGLSGSVSSGFEIESLKFKSGYKDRWNELRQVKFSYNGIFDLARSQRMIIEEASVASATIYSPITSDWNAAESIDEVNDELSDLDMDIETNNENELKEFRIDKLVAKNIRIIDPNNDDELNFRLIQFGDFQFKDGQVAKLGQLEIDSDQLDLHTEPSKRLSQHKVAWNIIGDVKTKIHDAVIADIPFEIDFAIRKDQTMLAYVNLFEKQLVIDDLWGDTSKYQLTDFNPQEYLDMQTTLAPSDINIGWSITSEKVRVAKESVTQESTTQGGDQPADVDDESADEIPAVEKTDEEQESQTIFVNVTHYRVNFQPEGQFVLGQTVFQLQTDELVFGTDESTTNRVEAVGQLNETRIDAAIFLDSTAPWIVVELTSAGMETSDIWSQLFFGQDYQTLDEERQQQVDTALEKYSPQPNFDAVEPVDF